VPANTADRVTVLASTFAKDRGAAYTLDSRRRERDGRKSQSENSNCDSQPHCPDLPFCALLSRITLL